MKTFENRYPSKYESVTRARREVVEFARQCGLAPADVADIALAAGEAFNNAAEHGHVAGGYFSVRCNCDQQRFSVEVRDEGKGFRLGDKGQRMDPELRGVRGLGIFLMRSFMDDVAYDITPHGTRVVLTKFSKRVKSFASANGHAKASLSAT